MRTSSSVNNGLQSRRKASVSAFIEALPAGTSSHTEPGYDSGLQPQADEGTVLVKNAIVSWPAGSPAPSGGDGEPDPEVAIPGYL